MKYPLNGIYNHTNDFYYFLNNVWDSKMTTEGFKINKNSIIEKQVKTPVFRVAYKIRKLYCKYFMGIRTIKKLREISHSTHIPLLSYRRFG